MESWKNLNLKNLDGEIWKIIKDFPDYKASNLGRIKSLKFRKEKILKQYKNTNDYFTVGLCRNKKHKIKKIHILVYETFNNCKLKSNECVHHKDENKENNNLDNFKLMTKSKHHSLHNSGENHPMFGIHRFGKKSPNFGNCKLNNNEIWLIQKILNSYLYKSCKVNQTYIGKMFKVSQSVISKIKSSML